MKLKQTIKYYSFSSPQREIWFDQMLHPEVPLYNVGGYVQINGAIDPVLFESAVNLLVQRHEALRTVLVPGTEEIPMQTFLEDLPVTVPVHDFSGENNPRPSALAWMQQQFVLHFDWYEKPLFHFALLKIDDNCFFVLMKYHHLIVDGWAISLITQSLAEIYTQLIQGQKIEGAAPSYLAFIENDRAYIESGRYEVDRQYWLEKYRTLPEPLFTPRYLSRFGDRIPPGERRVLWLPRPLYNRLLAFAKNTRSTLFHVMLGALYVDFARTTQREELAIGLPILNRNNATFKETVGLFIGVCPAWFQFGTALSFRQLLKAIGKALKSMYRHQRLPISELNRAVGIQKMGRIQLFDIQFNYAKHDHDTEFGVFKAKTIALTNNNEQAPLSISVWEFHKNENVQVDFVYNLAYFNSAEIERIQSRFVLILEYVLNHADESIRTIPLLTEAEQQQLQAWNQTETDYPKDLTIMDLFQAQVDKTPDHIAVVFEEQALSYRVLNTRANRLAHYLITLGVGAETLVGICVERSLEMVIGLLGILKAGGAYMPLDPDYPLSRLRFMLEDTSAPVLLKQSFLLERLPTSTAKVVCLDGKWEPIATGSGETPVRRSGPENLAYVIYTSGSTGVPRGVMVGHGSLTNLVYWHNQQFAVTQSDKATLLASPAFDASVWELWPYLTIGACICPVKAETAVSSIDTLKAWLDKKQITMTFLPTPLLENFLEETWESTTLRSVLTGGDALRTYLPSSCYFKLYNNYGPTENTVVTTSGEVPHGSNPDNPEFPSIGRPIANTQTYILDARHKPTPPGIPGELSIAGAGLARGYLNRPELTAEKFDQDLWDYQDYHDEKKRDNEKFWEVQEPFFKRVPGRRRLYKTGDLARWLPDGNLEFLGRLDHQVKLRGFRIELSEIEVVLARHEAVKEAVVVLYNKEENPCLAAYVTLSSPPDPVSGLTINEVFGVLRNWLKSRLPDYMLPASFTVLDKLPLTPNGKIDRRALPEPDLSIQVEQQVPRTETEHLLCNLWSRVLGIEVNSILSNFFEAGGHSLLATQLTSRVRESFGIEMPLRIIFERALLREQAEWLDKQQRGSELPPISPLARGDPLVLSFAQQRLWFLAQLEGQRATYNIPLVLHLEGQLNEMALQRTLTALIQRHDSLRLCFPMIDGEATVQLNDVYNPLSVTDLGELPGIEQQRRVREWIANHAQTPFNLSTGPLLSLRLLKLGKQEQILLFNMHHIISDGWSMGVLIREWSQLYNAYAQNQEPQLPKLPVQYTDYAAWQRSWLQGEVLEQQLAYWIEKLAGAPELLGLPTDYPHPAVMRYRGKHLRSTLDQGLMQGIKQLSRERGVTVFMTLLAAFKVLLSRYSGQSDLVVGSPAANRTHYQTEDLIGLFVNTLVLRTQIKGEQTFPELLEQVRQTALEAYNHQDIPFEYLVEQINPSRSLSHSPLFQVMFALQNAPKEALELSGLKMSFLESENTTAKFDLTLSVEEQGDVFVCDWEYCTDLFRPGTITRMTEHFQVLLEGILNPVSGLTFNPEQPLSQYPLLTEAEQQQLLAWNQTETDYPKDQTIVDLFQAQVEKTPDHIVVVFEEQALSYRVLNAKANRLVHYLMTLGVGAETLVGICVERSLEMVTGLLGILKAGGAYVPLDPDYPLSRLRFMLEDSSVPVLLSQSHLLERLPVSTAKVVCLDNEWEPIAAGSGENPVRQSGPENLAYVIYTSGSTGKPKGCQVTQSNVTRLFAATEAWYHFNPKDVWTLFHSYAFDFSVWEIWGPLSYGAKLVIVPYFTSRTPSSFYRLLIEQGVTVLNQTPSAFKQLINVDNRPDELSLRLVIFGGEVLDFASLQPWFARHGDRRPQLVNMYGITETTVHVTYYPLISGQNHGNSVIGRPIPDLQTWVVDAYLQPVSVGVPGEMVVGGAGVARGYLNRPELTAERFVCYRSYRNYFPGKIYRTGDSARWLPDLNLDYLGRIDKQVKIRGFRVELGEIEACLLRNPVIKEAVVMASGQDETKALTAYITVNTKLKVEELREYIGSQLPGYMVPSYFVQLDTLPLLPNGKINREALAGLKPLESSREYRPPQNDLESDLLSIWKKYIKTERLSTDVNFFEAGGNSLSLVRVHSEIEKKYPGVTLMDLFAKPNIVDLALFLSKKEKKNSAALKIEPLPLDKGYFSTERESGLLEYTLNLESLPKLKEHGNRENLDIQDILRTAFGYLLFEISNQNLIQYYVTLNDDQIISIRHNYEEINSIKELLQASRRQFLNPEQIYPVDDFMKTRANPGSYQVLPLYSNPLNREFENTDLHLQAKTKNGTVEIAFRFSPRMDREEMRQLPGLYAAIVEEIVNETRG